MSEVEYTMPMGKRAVGVYLKTLRELHGWSQERVADDLRLFSEKQLRRWEKGGADPASSSLIKLVHHINGQMRHVTRILLGDDDVIDQEVAKATAEQQYRITSLLEGDADRLAKVERLVDRLRTHPVEFGEWLGYGDRLIDELPDSA